MTFQKRFPGTSWSFMRCVILSFYLLFFSQFTSAQIDPNEDIQIRQRAILIYNFTQQVGWANFESLSEFKIGILGNDLIFSQLNAMAKTRTVHGKKMSIVKFNGIEDLSKVQLLYVNKRYNFDLTEVLQRITGQNTLLVSENYSFNESMINMINVAGSFKFQLNERRLEQENFEIPLSLKSIAISSLDKWQELYLSSQRSLADERNRVQQQKKLLRDQERLLVSQKDLLLVQQNKLSRQITDLNRGRKEIALQREQIKKRNQEFDSLSTQTNSLTIDYKSKVASLANLENQIKEQRLQLQEQQAKTLSQATILEDQIRRINTQKKVLEDQELELSTQKRLTYLLALIVALVLLTSFFIYRSYRIKRRTNLELAEKNQAIREKTTELEIRNREMEQFAYVASHDLQEPLHTISSLIELLSEEYKDSFDEKGTKSLNFIISASNRMRRLITELLEYSRLGTDLKFERIKCNDLLNEIKADFDTLIKETGAIVDVSKLPTIWGNRTEIRLLFQNLISNAIKFRKEGQKPEIRIFCQELKANEEEVSSWKFGVEDNGIGISYKHQSKVFTIFQRLHSKEAYKGTGIGLAHCRKIVELHKGRIWVNSEPDNGSTFFFKIPKKMPDNQVAASPS